MLCFFFFKQKTAYEMRISDWSSDVCSSDLEVSQRRELDCRHQLRFARIRAGDHDVAPERVVEEVSVLGDERDAAAQVVEPEFAKVDAVQHDAPLVRVPKAHEELRRRRLAGARGADERQSLPDRKSTRLNSSHSCEY